MSLADAISANTTMRKLAFTQRCYFGAKFLLSNELSARVDICIAFTSSQSDFSLKCEKMKC